MMAAALKRDTRSHDGKPDKEVDGDLLGGGKRKIEEKTADDIQKGDGRHRKQQKRGDPVVDPAQIVRRVFRSLERSMSCLGWPG